MKIYNALFEALFYHNVALALLHATENMVSSSKPNATLTGMREKDIYNLKILLPVNARRKNSWLVKDINHISDA